MVSKSLSLFDNLNSLTPYSVGYDSIFDRLNNAIESGHGTNYPPYNIKKKSDYVHRGISYRKFEKRFSIADDIQVKGAKLENGLLTIDLERIVPEEKKPRTIAIR